MAEGHATGAAADPSPRDEEVDEEVQVFAGPVSVAGHVTIPANAKAPWSSLTAAPTTMPPAVVFDMIRLPYARLFRWG